MTCRYCLDTSGLSNPLETTPEDIHETLWSRVRELIEEGAFAWNAEIADELGHLEGETGECIAGCLTATLHEIGDEQWDWPSYVANVNRMKSDYQAFISDYNGGRKGTIGLNDLSIVALALTLRVPVVSMEARNSGEASAKRLRIPDLCDREGVKHLTFNEFLREEGIKI